jgi:hypothetical protein
MYITFNLLKCDITFAGQQREATPGPAATLVPAGQRWPSPASLNSQLIPASPTFSKNTITILSYLPPPAIRRTIDAHAH